MCDSSSVLPASWDKVLCDKSIHRFLSYTHGPPRLNKVKVFAFQEPVAEGRSFDPELFCGLGQTKQFPHLSLLPVNDRSSQLTTTLDVNDRLVYCDLRRSTILRMLQQKIQQRRRTALALGSAPEGLLWRFNKVRGSKIGTDLIKLLRTLLLIGDLECEGEPSAEFLYSRQSSLYRVANEILASFWWSPRVASPPNEVFSFTWRAKTESSNWRNQFVFWILNLRKRGDLYLVRSCRNCGRWFYAVTQHQAHCKIGCRQKFHSRDSSFKEKRRLYMQDYRAEEKKRGRRAKEQVQFFAKRDGSRSKKGF